MNKAGTYVKNLSGEAAYLSFRPSPLPPTLEMSNEMLHLLTQATQAVAELNTLSKYVPNVNLFVSMYVRKEALLSSQIEGTQTTLEDVLDPSEEKNANQDVCDVINCAKATVFAISRLQELPLCNRLLCETHNVLMQGVRGEEKNPGQFRTSQNWIGPTGSSLKNAKYIPPNPEDMKQAMSDLEKYVNALNPTPSNALIRAALVHYQFETIHPFLDGNGRIGRLLVTLYLIDQKALLQPTLYLSYYLKKNRIEYYDRMSEVRGKDNYEQWVTFFLQAIRDSALDAVKTIQQLVELRTKNLERLAQNKATPSILRIYEYLEQNPIIDVRKTAQALGLSFGTANNAVKKLTDLQILHQETQKNRNRIFAYQDYINILKKDT